MFRTNVGSVDRFVRAVIGLVVIAGYFVWPDLSYSWAFWLGLVPLATIFGWCPIYAMFGWSTHHDKQDGPSAKA
ncbi:MAG: DUF2892 domain-containing protein [Paracoccaceae bacterium]